MDPSHPTFSWRLYKTFTRTLTVWKLHIGRWRETELSFAALVFGTFASLVLSKCTGNAFLNLCCSSDQYLSCHINWPLVSDHYSAFCVFAPLLCTFLFTFSIALLSLLIPSLAHSPLCFLISFCATSIRASLGRAGLGGSRAEALCLSVWELGQCAGMQQQSPEKHRQLTALDVMCCF